MLDYLFEKPISQWDHLSSQQVIQSLANPETRSNFTLYLQSKPHKMESRLIKEFMIEQWKQSSVPEINPRNAHPTGEMRRTDTLVSLLTDNSAVHDSQLAYYAQVIENTLKKSESHNTDQMAKEGAEDLDKQLDDVFIGRRRSYFDSNHQ